MVETKNNTGQRARATTRLFRVASAQQAMAKTCKSNARKCLFNLFPIQRMTHLSCSSLGTETTCLCFTAKGKQFLFLSLKQTKEAEVLKPCPTSTRCQPHPLLQLPRMLFTFCYYSSKREGVHAVRRIYCVMPYARAEDFLR